LEADKSLIVAGESGRIRLPIPSVLIEHPDGLALFDTGLHSDLQHDPSRMGNNQKFFTVQMNSDDDLASNLDKLGVDAARIRYVVNSHLHFDHCGGNAQVPNATVVIQKPEWQAGQMTKLIERDVYNPADYALGHDVLEIEGEHDLFGDGRVMCVPTYGHTAGHQSLVINTDDGRFVFAADTCYFKETLAAGKLPAFGFDLDMQRQSLGWLGDEQKSGSSIIFGHDPEQWPELCKQTETLKFV
jgi:glyoxylase-like metal-dependent hydrolase (beta-lactamase superfamily II)